MRRYFFELAELHTLLLNVFIVLLGVAYSSFFYQQGFNLEIIFYLLSVCFFHVTVNIHNNYCDYLNASHNPYYQKEINVIGKKKLELPLVKKIYQTFLFFSVLLGVGLALGKGLGFWLLGLIAFAIGLLYSGGPRPINSLPIAETLPSLGNGFGIPLGSAYLALQGQNLFSAVDVGRLFLVSLPLVLATFSFMHANNTCDLTQDIKNNRRTLVYYIGPKNAVGLLKVVMVGIQIIIFLLGLFQLAPKTVWLELLIMPLLWKLLQPYFVKQEKDETFMQVVKGGSLVMVVYSLCYSLGSFF